MGDHPQRRNWDQEAPDYGTVFIVLISAQQEDVGFSTAVKSGFGYPCR
jgi:hypothetical protein